jgi:hypothetical protein
VRKVLSEPTVLSLPSRAFGTLTERERRTLQRWIVVARAAGIDGVEDLTSRDWPAAIAGVVIGVFVSGDDKAVWLAVEQGGYWAVAFCVEGRVSPRVDSLDEALALVYSAAEGSE